MSATDLVKRYYEAINASRWDDYDELFADDAELEAPGGLSGRGPAAMRAFDKVWKRAAPDFTVTILVQTGDDTRLASENLAEGTQTGILSLPTGDIPPTGRTFGGRYVGVFETRNGRLSAQRIYFDRMQVAEQLTTEPSIG